MRQAAAIAAWFAATSVFFLYLGLHVQDSQINKLQKDVACLKHPHGESSITAVRGKDGKFHVSTPVRTGC